MDKDRDELLPCPFCGEKVISTFYVRDGRAVGCTDCAASLTAYQPDAEQKAIAAWNRRPKECEHIWMRSLRPDRVQGTWCGKCGVVAAPPEQLEQVAQEPVAWNSAATDPSAPGWYRVRLFNDHADVKIRAWGKNQMWWIPASDGWITGPFGWYEWQGPALAELEPEESEMTPIAEMERAALAAPPAAEQKNTGD